MTTSEPSSLGLDTPLADVPGVGLGRARILRRLGLRRLRGLLLHFPRSWESPAELRTVETLQEGEPSRLVGRVVEVDLRNTAPGRSVLGVLIQQGSRFVRCVWFNQPQIMQSVRRGQIVLLEGKPKQNGLRWEFHHPKLRTTDREDDPAASGPMLPVYPLTEGVAQPQMRRLLRMVVPRYAKLFGDPLPEDLRQRLDLPEFPEALQQFHFPENDAQRLRARRRLAFQELLVLQLALGLRRRNTQQRPAEPLPSNGRIDGRIRRLLPFQLTAGQNAAVRQVTADLARTQPMNRLLQGDVGSGKTVVALYAMLVAVANEHQAVLMCPTEVLAQQHGQAIDRLLSASRVRRAVLTGSLPPHQRQRIREQIASGELDLIVGTQALLSQGVEFPRLGVAVIDEQHKFGVRQRAGLRAAGKSPHVLVMSATPIPRSLGLTLYGDLDITTVTDRPPGRAPVYTYCVGDDHRERWWDFVRKKLDAGHQAYVIAPRIRQEVPTPQAEEAPDTTAAPAVDEARPVAPLGVEQVFDELSSGALAGYRLGLLHGQLPTADKQRVLDDFRKGWTQVLVATTVVEVGVDVPNATLMTIEQGHRFGLATLHQLRGRISRGPRPGYCTVFGSPEDATGRRRLEAFETSHDGFALAELDFQLRGPGSFLGTRQSGLPPLYVADLAADAELLSLAKAEAATLLDSPQGWPGPWTDLGAIVHRKYGRVFDLGDVG